MKLQAGDQIKMTVTDGKAKGGERDFAMPGGAIFAEWDGSVFHGCMIPASAERATWSLDELRFFQEEMQERPDARTNIDCMFEQLVAEGAV